MALAVVYSRARLGMDAPLVTVEVHLSGGLPAFNIVGLPETAVKESRDRVRGALLNCNYEFPARRITVNLAPADLPKQGSRFDLPIAIGILAATRQVPANDLARYEFAAELALSGTLRPVHGMLPMALQTTRAQRMLIIAQQNTGEATLVHNARALGAGHLLQVTAHLCGTNRLPEAAATDTQHTGYPAPELADVRGQHRARRALEIAASGAHSLLMLGPPGTGKSLLASRLPGILPGMTESEALETALVRSSAGLVVDPQHWRVRPFRAPHHTASAIALTGGGATPRPGEISLAHNGVLFLDELPEFDRRALEVLREPLESGHIVISRAALQSEFPARFQLVAAMNPCACGWLGDASGRCRCTGEQVQRYRNRISGPLLDRIDLHVEVSRLSFAEIQGTRGECSADVRQRVGAAQEIQLQRSGILNSRLSIRQLEDCCRLDPGDLRLLQQAMEKLRLSVRAQHRILKLARTIADMDACTAIARKHLTEAIGYRCLDRPVLAEP